MHCGNVHDLPLGMDLKPSHVTKTSGTFGAIPTCCLRKRVACRTAPVCTGTCAWWAHPIMICRIAPRGHYFSVLIVHRDDHAETLSDLSGRHDGLQRGHCPNQVGPPPCAYFARHDLAFKTGLQTGGHALSARAVDEGQADFASLDAVTWAMLRNEAPALTDRLRVVARTDPTPGLPYITALTQNAPRVARAVSHAIESLEPAHKQTLFLKELVQIPADAYLGFAPAPASVRSARTSPMPISTLQVALPIEFAPYT